MPPSRKERVMSLIRSRNQRRLAAWIAIGFVAGAASVLLFHQGMAALLNALELSGRAAYSMQPTEPYGVPKVASLTFWGGVWGVVFAMLLLRLEGARLVVASLLLGAVLPTLFAWAIVAPLKGQIVDATLVPTTLAYGVIVNAAWGLGTGLILALLGFERRFERRRGAVDRRKMDRRQQG